MSLREDISKPFALSLAINRSWEIQSNAFERSIKIAPTYLLLSSAFFQSSIILIRTCCVLNPLSFSLGHAVYYGLFFMLKCTWIVYCLYIQ